jgi:hypothetical protein
METVKRYPATLKGFEYFCNDNHIPLMLNIPFNETFDEKDIGVVILYFFEKDKLVIEDFLSKNMPFNIFFENIIVPNNLIKKGLNEKTLLDHNILK